MAQNYGPHRLVIQQLDILETAPKIIEDVERHVFSAIDEKFRQWVESRKDWEGAYNFLASETSFKPEAWAKTENGPYQVWFELNGDRSIGYIHTLSALMGIVPAKFDIWFCVNASWVTRLEGKGVRPAAEWKRFLAEQYPSTRLSELGLSFMAQTCFCPSGWMRMLWPTTIPIP
jgi:hypothetical protein